MEQQIAMLQQELENRNEIIHQLQVEAAGAAEAAHAARAAQAEHAAQTQKAAAQANVATANAETVLKTLQTPQIIRDLPSFSGDSVKLHSFIRSIDNLIPLIDSVRGTSMHVIWIQAIRSKIIGEADNVLELYGTNLDWTEIKANLITHYSDRRDEVSLTRDLFNNVQSGTVEDFYGKISHIVSLLVNLLNINESNAQVKTAKNMFYQQMGLKVFLSGLKEPLGPIIRAQTPNTLKEALRLCLEENNYHYGKNTTRMPPPPIPFKPHKFTSTPHPPNPRPFLPYPPIQPRNPYLPYPPIQRNPYLPYPARQPFNPFQVNQVRPQLAHQHKPFPYTNPSPFPRQLNIPFAPKFNTPQNSKPTPMEVDPSIRSRKINYLNRPHYQIEEETPEEMYFLEPPYEWNDYYYQPQDAEYAEFVDNTTHCDQPEKPTEKPAQETSNTVTYNNGADDLNFQTAGFSTEKT